MSIYSDLLFHQGHIADVALARSLVAEPNTAPAAAAAPETASRTQAKETQVMEVTETKHRARALIRRTVTALSPFR